MISDKNTYQILCEKSPSETMREKFFSAIVQNNMGLFILLLDRFTKDIDEKKDIIQEAITNVWEVLQKLSDDKFYEINLKGYIAASIRNEAIRCISKKRNETVELSSELITPMYELNTNILKLNSNIIEMIKKEIGEKSYSILEMSVLERLSYQEIGKLENINPNTVATLLFRAKQKLSRVSSLRDLLKYE